MKPPKPPRQAVLGLVTGWEDSAERVAGFYRETDDPALQERLHALRADLVRHREALAELAGTAVQGRLPMETRR